MKHFKDSLKRTCWVIYKKTNISLSLTAWTYSTIFKHISHTYITVVGEHLFWQIFLPLAFILKTRRETQGIFSDSYLVAVNCQVMVVWLMMTTRWGQDRPETPRGGWGFRDRHKLMKGNEWCVEDLSHISVNCIIIPRSLTFRFYCHKYIYIFNFLPHTHLNRTSTPASAVCPVCASKSTYSANI